MPREVVVASGKGGTGKTTVAAFIISHMALQGGNVLGVDADVEAPDLIIALGGGEILSRNPVYESEVAVIDYDKCTACGACRDICQFGAVEWDDRPIVISELCEGCMACKYVCNYDAIRKKVVKTGEIVTVKSKYGKIITGRLELGRKHSGKMVDLLRGKAKTEEHPDVIVVDAAAGTGCPVISSIVGADLLVIVLEPTRYSLLSAQKIMDIGRMFSIEMGAVINKYNINPSYIVDIEEWARRNEIDVLGTIPYDEVVVEAYVNMVGLIEYAPNSDIVASLSNIADRIYKMLGV